MVKLIKIASKFNSDESIYPPNCSPNLANTFSRKTASGYPCFSEPLGSAGREAEKNNSVRAASMTDLLRHSLLKDEEILWHRVVPWKEQRYGWVVRWVYAVPTTALFVGLLVLLFLDSPFWKYAVHLLAQFAAFTGLSVFFYAQGMFNEAHEAISTKRILFAKNMSGSLYLSSAMYSSIATVVEEVRTLIFRVRIFSMAHCWFNQGTLVKLIRQFKAPVECFHPMDAAQRSYVISLISPKIGSSQLAADAHLYALPATFGGVTSLPRKMQQKMLSHGDAETSFVSSVGLFGHLWPGVLFIFVGGIPGIIVGILAERASGSAEPGPHPDGGMGAAQPSFIAANIIFVGIGVKILVASTLTILSGFFGRRHFAITESAVYTGVTYFGDRGMFLLRRYSITEFLHRAQLHSKLPAEKDRSISRFLFPDSAISITPDSIFELNRFPVYVENARSLYDWAVARDGLESDAKPRPASLMDYVI